MLSEKQVTSIYLECLNYIKSYFPTYYNIVKDYKFKFGNKKRSYGTCSYRYKEILIHMYKSKYNTEDEVKDTILHEMAHAINMGLYNNSGHGRTWKIISTMIGSNPKSRARKGIPVISKSKYIIVLDEGDKLKFIMNKHRKSKSININSKIPGSYLVGDKKSTYGKLMYITWDRFLNDYKMNKISTGNYSIEF